MKSWRDVHRDELEQIMKIRDIDEYGRAMKQIEFDRPLVGWPSPSTLWALKQGWPVIPG
jgi:hypothetical protein